MDTNNNVQNNGETTTTITPETSDTAELKEELKEDEPVDQSMEL